MAASLAEALSAGQTGPIDPQTSMWGGLATLGNPSDSPSLSKLLAQSLVDAYRSYKGTNPRLVPVDRVPSAVMSPEDQAAMSPETFANPMVGPMIGGIASIPQRAIEGSQEDVNHLGEPGYQMQAIAPAADAAMLMMGGAGVVPAEANALRSGVSLLKSHPMRQNPFHPTPELVDSVHAAAQAAPDMHIGLRIDNGQGFAKGQSLPESRVWVDGTPLEDTVGGVSTLGLTEPVTRESIVRALQELGPYAGDQLVLVGGKGASIGEDVGEHIIRNGRAVNVFSPTLTPVDRNPVK